MKYIKQRYQFLNEAFDSKAISKTLAYLDKVGNKSKSEFLKVLKKMKDNYDYPIDKIDDAFIKYTNRKEALKIKFDGELQNSWGIYCIKFWFSLELGYLGYTATSNKNYKYSVSKSGKNNAFDNGELNYIKTKFDIKTGLLTPVKDYTSLRTGEKVIGCFASHPDHDYISPATIIVENGRIYAIQNVAEGDYPSEYQNWEQFGTNSWTLGRIGDVGNDHSKLHHYENDDKLLRVKSDGTNEVSENPLEWNLPVRSSGNISNWGDDYSSIEDDSELDKADFSIVLFFDDMINPDKAEFYERPSDISKEREESRKGSLKLMSDEEIKKVNLERYLNKLVSLIGVSADKSDVKNLQKVIRTSLAGKYSLISIFSGNYKGIDNFISYLYNLIKHLKDSKDIEDERSLTLFKRDREYYFKEVMDQYKTIYNRSLTLKKYYDDSYNWIIKNHSSESEEDILIIEILSKVIEIGNKIFDIVSNQEVNSIQDMKVLKSKIDTIKNILFEDVFLLPDRIQAIFKYFNDLSDVSYYMDRISKKDLEETKEKLEDIEKAINSILK
jgi:hypothetical protein